MLPRRRLADSAGRAWVKVRPYRRSILVLSVMAVVWVVWISGPGWATPAVVVAAVAGAAVGVIDARTQRVPNAIVYPAFVACAVLLAVAAVATGEWGSLARAGLGSVALGGGYLILHVVGPRGLGLGLGDVKLAAVVGLIAGWHSWQVVWWSGVLPLVLGGLVAAALLVSRRADRHTMLSFGPFMLVGAAVAMSWAHASAA